MNENKKEPPYYPYPPTEEDLIDGVQTTVYCQWMGLKNSKMRESLKVKNYDSTSIDASIASERDCLDWFNKKFGLKDPDPLFKIINKKN